VLRKGLAFSVAALVVLAACSSSSKSSTTGATSGSAPTTVASKNPINVVAVLSTGQSGAGGEQAQVALIGLKAAAQVLNQHGGILGRQIKIEAIDDAGNPTTGAGLLQQRLQSTPKPDVIIPGSISTEGVAYVPIATSAGVLSIGTPSALSLLDPAKYPYNFSMPPSQVAIADEMFQYVKQNGGKKIAAISSQSAFGSAWAQAAKQASTKNGVPGPFETYADTELDLTAALQRLKASNPDFLLVQGFGAPVGVVLDSRVKLGWNIPTLCESTCGVTPLVVGSKVGTPDEANFKIQVPLIDIYTPPAKRSMALTDYINALKAFGPITGIMTQYSFQYDALMVVAQAATQANSVATPELAKALENLQQPATPRWVTLAQYHWSSTSHAAMGSGNDYPMVVPTHLVDGQVGAPGA
jgi:branched-chain amino acid transport system substrate-binding protein